MAGHLTFSMVCAHLRCQYLNLLIPVSITVLQTHFSKDCQACTLSIAWDAHMQHMQHHLGVEGYSMDSWYLQIDPLLSYNFIKKLQRHMLLRSV